MPGGRNLLKIYLIPIEGVLLLVCRTLCAYVQKRTPYVTLPLSPNTIEIEGYVQKGM